MTKGPEGTSKLPLDRYAPRRLLSLGLWEDGGSRFKVYGIEADGERLDDETADAARHTALARAGDLEAVGFAILHRGEEAVWLLLHWWMPGGSLAELLWRRELGGGEFVPVDRPFMACVWELVPISFERNGYVNTIMSGAGPQDYLDRLMPEGSV